MDNPLLQALQSNYGDGSAPPPDTTTVRGLLAFCKQWPDGDTDAEDLNNPCLEMSGRLKAGAKAQEDDLAQNPDLVEARKEPMARMAESYWTIAEVLDKLPGLAAADDRNAYQEAIEIFEEERNVVLDCNEEVEMALSGRMLACPRCGDMPEEAEICESCQLTLLYPDPQSLEYDRNKTAVLPPVYGDVFQAYTSVMSGTADLSVVLNSVNTLEQALKATDTAYREAAGLTQDEDDGDEEYNESQELVTRLLKGVDDALGGVGRVRQASESRAMADLSRGWDTIFDAAVDIKRSTEAFAKKHGLIEQMQAEVDNIQFDGT